MALESDALPTALRGPANRRRPNNRALDKKEYLMIVRDTFYVVSPHLNRLDETVQMRDHNI